MVLQMSTKYKRRRALETLPTTPNESYRSIITRIRECPNACQAELGMQVLMWLHFAHRPLKLEELQHALAVEKGCTAEFHTDNIPSLKALLDSCFGLVVLDNETTTVRFMHFTLEEYFRDNAKTEFPDGCSSIAETCLTYLNFGELREHCIDLDSLQEKMAKYAFLNYASLYWGTYYVEQQCSDSLKKLARMVVEHQSEHPPCSIQALYFDIDLKWYDKKIAQKFSGIHVVAYFGLSEDMAGFSDMGLKDDCGLTPLSWAAREGHEAVVRLLVKKDNIDINAKDNEGRTPLILAAYNGHEAVVRLLIERDDIDINVKDDEGVTPFIWAACNGHEAVVRLLIGRDDIDINAKTRRGKTPLMWAAYNGHEAVVRLLIERDDIDINAKDNQGVTPLILAALNKHEVIVQLLIERDDIDINAKDKWGDTPLILAAWNGHEAVVRRLIERDNIDLNAKDKGGMTPLILAAWNGHEAVVRLLIGRGDIDINAKDNEGRTPLVLAAKKGHKAVVQLLKDRCDAVSST